MDRVSVRLREVELHTARHLPPPLVGRLRAGQLELGIGNGLAALNGLGGIKRRESLTFVHPCGDYGLNGWHKLIERPIGYDPKQVQVRDTARGTIALDDSCRDKIAIIRVGSHFSFSVPPMIAAMGQ